MKALRSNLNYENGETQNLLTQSEITKSHKIIFEEKEGSRPDALANLLAVCKAQDQMSGGMSFSSQKTNEFKKKFGIKDCENGFIIEGEVFDIRDAKKYLTEKFTLGNSKEKIDSILSSQNSLLTKSQEITDVIFKDFVVDNAVKVGEKIAKYTPSLASISLALGVAQLISRSIGDQETANKIRDNIGASTEAASFFVFANGLLENLTHSFLLAAPAYASVGIYDKLITNYKTFCQSFTSQNSENNLEQIDTIEQRDDIGTIISFLDKNSQQKAIESLTWANEVINDEKLWKSLRESQLAYKFNDIEESLKSNIASLIVNLKDNPTLTNDFIKNSNQTIVDCFEMLKAYKEVYEKNNPSSQIKEHFDQFLETFAVDEILLKEPSKEAQQASFYYKIQENLVSFEERIKNNLLPHMPSGSQVTTAIFVIAALYSASAIYKAATGEEETYSNYITDFPDHLFKWLGLEQMYENMGGGAEVTEGFKDFFAKFNLAENSTHLGIMALPILRYREIGSKMFEGIYETPANYLAYAKQLTNSYYEGFRSYFGISQTASTSQKEMVVDDLENGAKILSEEKSDFIINFDDSKEKEEVDNSRTIELFCGEITSSKKSTKSNRRPKKVDKDSQTDNLEFESKIKVGKKDQSIQASDNYDSSDSKIDYDKISIRDPRASKLKKEQINKGVNNE